jgi:hypothetical protein
MKRLLLQANASVFIQVDLVLAEHLLVYQPTPKGHLFRHAARPRAYHGVTR